MVLRPCAQTDTPGPFATSSQVSSKLTEPLVLFRLAGLDFGTLRGEGVETVAYAHSCNSEWTSHFSLRCMSQTVDGGLSLHPGPAPYTISPSWVLWTALANRGSPSPSPGTHITTTGTNENNGACPQSRCAGSFGDNPREGNYPNSPHPSPHYLSGLEYTMLCP